MDIMKVRKVGNSRTITLPHRFAGFEEGSHVHVEQLATGEVLITPVRDQRESFRLVGRQVINRHRESLDRLAAYDRGEATIATNRAPGAAKPE